MSSRITGPLLVAVLALGAFIYFYEIGGEVAQRRTEERGQRLFGGDLEAEDVTWIALRTSDGVDARIERREGAWQMVEPLVHPADAAVEGIAQALAALSSEKVLETPQSFAEYGLDEASARVVRFGTREGTHQLWLGKETPVGTSLYARVDGADSVHTVTSFRIQALDRTLSDLRDKQILQLDNASRVREIEVRWPGGRVMIERVDPPDRQVQEEWRLTAPLSARADADVVYDLLTTLMTLRAEGFVQAPSEATRRLLDPPDFEVTLRSGAPGDDPIAALRVGRPDAANLRPVRAGSAELFEIRADRIDDFPREVIAYRHRRLASFESTEVERLEFLFRPAEGDPVAITARRNARDWSASREKFAPGALSRIVSELSRLEADEIVAESAGDAKLVEFGLSPPKAILSVFGTPESDPDVAEDELAPSLRKLAEVHLGRVTSEGVIARAAGDRVVYRLAPEIAGQLPVSLEVFRSRFRAAEEPKPADGAEK